MDEFALIDEFFARRSCSRPDVRVGIGDDAAVTTIEAGYELVVATDTVCEGTHFPANTDPHALGHRCLAVNLSDLAAMGAEPLWCTLVLSMPEADPDWLRAFADGFFALAGRHTIALIGGDTVKGPLALTVTVHGRVRPGAYVRRNGAEPGQAIFVTGYPGEAGAGLQLLSKPERAADATELLRRFLYPEPRLREGQSLVPLATAMIDVSDGLQADLSRLLRASRVGAKIELDRAPLSSAVQAMFGKDRALELLLNGGDDYELCFVVPTGQVDALYSVARAWDCNVTNIGETTGEPEIRFTFDGRDFRVPDTSFQHFSAKP